MATPLFAQGNSLGDLSLEEYVLDRRYRSINLRAFNNPEELIGAPQNARRVTIGLQVRVR